MKRTNLVVVILLAMLLLPVLSAASVEFELLTDPNNVHLLPQQNGECGVSGDHLLQTDDDIMGTAYNPDGCMSFNFMNPVGISEPNYPPGYAEGIHSIGGSLILDIDLLCGGSLTIDSLAFDGYVAPGKPIAHQRLVQPGDPAADGDHGPINGMPNAGSYGASAALNWAFNVSFDWYYDTPYSGPGTIDMTFDNYQWNGFIIPVCELTPAGMAAVTLDDPLGFFGGTSVDFELWLLNEVVPQLPPEATYLFFAQGQAHPDWTDPQMGMTTDGIVAETIIAYTVTILEHNADIDGDGDVDLYDFAILAGQWQQSPGEPSADIAPVCGDGIVDIDDLAFLAENWLWGVDGH